MSTALFANAAKEAYRLLRTRYRDEPFRFRPEDELRWRELGKALFTQRLDPFSYVKFVFERYSTMMGDIYPAQICSSSMVARYRAARPEIVRDLELVIRLQADALRARMDNGWDLSAALADPLGDFSAIFCFAAAWSEGRHDVAEKYREGALRALLFEPEYKRILRKWLPKEMKE